MGWVRFGQNILMVVEWVGCDHCFVGRRSGLDRKIPPDPTSNAVKCAKLHSSSFESVSFNRIPYVFESHSVWALKYMEYINVEAIFSSLCTSDRLCF